MAAAERYGSLHSAAAGIVMRAILSALRPALAQRRPQSRSISALPSSRRSVSLYEVRKPRERTTQRSSTGFLAREEAARL
jgi:hypothetical protein